MPVHIMSVYFDTHSPLLVVEV